MKIYADIGTAVISYLVEYSNINRNPKIRVKYDEVELNDSYTLSFNDLFHIYDVMKLWFKSKRGE